MPRLSVQSIRRYDAFSTAWGTLLQRCPAERALMQPVRQSRPGHPLFNTFICWGLSAYRQRASCDTREWRLPIPELRGTAIWIIWSGQSVFVAYRSQLQRLYSSRTNDVCRTGWQWQIGFQTSNVSSVHIFRPSIKSTWVYYKLMVPCVTVTYAAHTVYVWQSPVVTTLYMKLFFIEYGWFSANIGFLMWGVDLHVQTRGEWESPSILTSEQQNSHMEPTFMLMRTCFKPD